MNEVELKKLVLELRIDLLKMFYKSKTGHLAPALSCLDILVTLYFSGVMQWKDSSIANRDRIILSKGHACAALYVVLSKCGFFKREELATFYQKGTRLLGHPTIDLPGIETITGSLGHGICFATGVAKVAKIDNERFSTYVIIGDGELQEGSVWEAIMFAAHHRLNNLIVILDKNGLQASENIMEITGVEPVREKWVSFGWNVLECNGHNIESLFSTIYKARESEEKPTLIIANTIKGKGISFIENKPEWHSRAPKGKEWELICKEMGISMEELEEI